MLKLIQSVITGLGAFFRYLGNNELIKAGEDREKGKQAENALKDIDRVKQIKKDVSNLSGDELDRELRGNEN